MDNTNQTNTDAAEIEANERAKALLDSSKPFVSLGAHFKPLMILLVLSGLLLLIMLMFERILFAL